MKRCADCIWSRRAKEYTSNGASFIKEPFERSVLYCCVERSPREVNPDMFCPDFKEDPENNNVPS